MPESSELCRFLRKQFPDINIEELNEAFDLYCGRALNLDYKRDGHYNKLSGSFVGTVLSAFRKYREGELKKFSGVQTYTEPKITMQELFEKCLFQPFDKFMSGEPYPYSVLDGWLFFDELYKMGFRLVQDEEMRQAFKEEAEKQTPRIIGRMKRRIFDLDETVEDHQRRVKKTAKHLAFKSWIEEKQFEDCDLRALICPLLVGRK